MINVDCSVKLNVVSFRIFRVLSSVLWMGNVEFVRVSPEHKKIETTVYLFVVTFLWILLHVEAQLR